MDGLKLYNGRVPACGIFCGGCPIYIREKNPCPGAEINRKRCENCKTFHLCCLSHNISHCYQCQTFPCSKLKGFAKRWLKYGQNCIENQRSLQILGEEGFLHSFNKKVDYYVDKPLSEMSNEKLWQLFPIIVCEHQEYWAENYQVEKKNLEKIITEEGIERISHIGSTAVPGLLSKPTIDILLEIKENTGLEDLIAKMESMDYIYSPQPNKPSPHMMFLKGYTTQGFRGQAFHVHVRYKGDWDEIYFRDYLLSHPDAVQKYGQLKRKLEKKYKHDRDGYTEAKTEFIKKIKS